MFIGHYGPALAATPFARGAPLWTFFVAVQLVDIAWGGFIAAGVEHVRIVPGFTEVNALDLYDMPYTHSLVAAVAWSLGAALAWRFLVRVGGTTAAVLIGLAVFSHWLLDLIVHTPDLALWPGGPKVGFGLWNNAPLTFSIEALLVLAGMALYVRGTEPKNVVGRAAPVLLLVVLALMGYIGFVTPPGENPVETGLMGIVAYGVLALAAAGVDLTRRLKRPV